MRLFIVILLLPFSLIAQHKTIAKTIFYNKPNGEPVFYFNKGVDLKVYEIGYSDVNTSLQTSGWREARAKRSFFLKVNVKNYILQKNSIILNENKQEIGRTLCDINIFKKIDTSKPLKDSFEVWLNGYAKLSNIHELSYKEIIQKEKIHFSTEGESDFIILDDNEKNERPHFKSKETSYKVLTRFNRDEDDTYILLKTCKTTTDNLGFGGVETTHSISVTAFPDILNKKKSVFFKREGVHSIELIDNYCDFYYWQVLTFGCCLSPAKTELADFKTGKTLISCLETYYEIQFQESNDFILVGYNHNLTRGYRNGVIGFLNYSINGKKDGQVIFKAKQKNYADSCYYDGVSSKPIRLDSTDKVFDWENYKIKVAYDYYYRDYYDSSFGGNTSKPLKFKSVYDAKGIGLELTFVAEVNGSKIERKAKVIFNNGEAKDKEIIIDFD